MSWMFRGDEGVMNFAGCTWAVLIGLAYVSSLFSPLFNAFCAFQKGMKQKLGYGVNFSRCFLKCLLPNEKRSWPIYFSIYLYYLKTCEVCLVLLGTKSSGMIVHISVHILLQLFPSPLSINIIRGDPEFSMSLSLSLPVNNTQPAIDSSPEDEWAMTQGMELDSLIKIPIYFLLLGQARELSNNEQERENKNRYIQD